MSKKSSVIEETKLRIFERDHFRCQHGGCCEKDRELAHHIGQGYHSINHTRTEWNREFKENRGYNWIEANVIHNGLNMSTSCRKHNDYFNIGNNPGKILKKLYEIRESLKIKGVVK
jgi:hypothetical protein